MHDVHVQQFHYSAKYPWLIQERTGASYAVAEYMTIKVWGHICYPPPFRRKAEGHRFWLSVARGAWFRIFCRYFVPLTTPTILSDPFETLQVL